MKYFDLNKEEVQILEDFEKEKFGTIDQVDKETKRYKQAAKETLGKTKNINIRLSHKDLLKLKSRAVASGIPYQTLVASVLHRFANQSDSLNF
ncbi:hypothetical protein CO181_03905 [candidate division WWE3 bacterium CG_4_9_14_3_um_filter_43_9]|uniref:Antitoxin n=1 Tax=candidate division WWE3 bacterium CG_4_9_14_3_um_filter_43_9 TaxID=1975082 RepID=A0A2M7WWE7_UNCKA|nr:MAG: hypothetical protein CO181_03905 [candidate division WWE3 bacterium CG_4_9_14_3_um_filter_43_9]